MATATQISAQSYLAAAAHDLLQLLLSRLVYAVETLKCPCTARSARICLASSRTYPPTVQLLSSASLLHLLSLPHCTCRPSVKTAAMALAQCSSRITSNAAAAASGRSVAAPARAVRCVRVAPRAAAAPGSSSSSSRGSAVQVRAAGTKQQEAEARWTQQVKDGVVMNVSNKSAGEALLQLQLEGPFSCLAFG
jgi:hypothetical protein